MANKYLEKIASVSFHIVNPIRTVTPVKGIINTVTKGGVKGSAFGKTIKPGSGLVSSPKV